MNLERWISTRSKHWQELEKLLGKIERNSLSSLDKTEIFKLGHLYRLASADLCRIRLINPNSDIAVRLNHLVLLANNEIYANHHNQIGGFYKFFSHDFPLLVQQKAGYIVTAMLLVVFSFLASYFLCLNDNSFAQLELAQGTPLVGEDLIDTVSRHKLWTDSMSSFSPSMSSMIATNNIRVSILAFALGISGGLGTVFILTTNGLLLGSAFAVCASHGLAHNLAAFVASHGVLELTAIFISGGSGLMIGQAMLFPGNLSRLDSLKQVAPQAVSLFCGTIPILLVAGIIEGFISPRTDIPAIVKYTISISTAIFLFSYLLYPRSQNQIDSRK
jgi:uncharacterized membrane protein SpoIIM required for sporulation